MEDALIIQVDSSQVEKGKRSLADLATQGKKTEQAFDGLGKAGKDAGSGLGSMLTSVKGLAGGFAALAVAQKAIASIDVYTKFNAQLKLATRSQQEFALATSDVSKIARVAQADIASIGTLYARINNSVRDLGASQKETADITENVALALKVSGATATETASAVLQLSQAFGSGVLRGEEFNAVNEAAPALMRALAESIGVPIGKLRELASNGQLTGDVLLKAFGDDKLLEKFREQAKGVQTISGGFAVFTNQLVVAIGKINEASGASKILIGTLEKAATLLSIFEGGEKGSILRNALDKGVSARQKQLSGLSITELKSASGFFKDAKDELARRLKDAGQTKFGGDLPSKTFAPNFSAGIEAQDVNKIHQLQEAKNQAAASGFNDAKQKADQLRKHKEDNENKLYALQRELEKDLEDRETKHQKLVRENNLALAKDKEALENKQYELANDLEKSLEDRELKHQKLIRGIKEDAAKEQLKAQQEIANSLNKSLTDALLRGFESGKGFAQNFRDTLINMFKTLVLQPTISATLKPLTDFIAGIGSKDKPSGGGIFGSASNLLSVGRSIYSGFSGALSSNIGGLVANFAPSLGSSIAGSMLGSAAGLGPTVAGSATGIGSLVGSVGSLGSAISTALPYIGLAITAFTVIKSLLGKKKIPRFSTLRAGEYADGVFTGRSNGQQYKPLGAEKQLDGLSEQFSRTLGGFLKGFGISDSISTTASLFKKRKASYGNFAATFAGGSVTAGEQGKAKNVQQTFEKLVETVLGSTLVQAIQKTKVVEGIKALFNGLTDKTQVVNMINASVTLQEAQTELADKYGLTVDLAGKVSVASGEAGDALAGFVNSLSAVALSGRTVGAQLIKNKDKLFTDFNTVFGDVITEAVLSTVTRQVPIAAATQATRTGGVFGLGQQDTGLTSFIKSTPVQQFQTISEQVTTFVDRIVSRNLQLPRTIADYDALLKNIDKTTLAGQKMFAEVFDLRDEFVAKIGAENGLKGNLRSGLASIGSDADKQKLLNEDLKALFDELKLSVPATIQELIKLGNSALADLNTGAATEATYNLAAAFPTLISAFKETKDGIVSLVNSLRDESGFKTLYDFNFYKGIANNYGNEFANRFTDGAPVTYGASNNTSASVPLNIAPNNNTTISTSDPNMLNAITRLIDKVNILQTELVSIKANTKSSADTLIRVSPTGNSIQTVAAV